jgi:hypothetical protein
MGQCVVGFYPKSEAMHGTASCILTNEGWFDRVNLPPETFSIERGERGFIHRGDDLGYFVVYEDGYQSWSPTEAFEKGYTKRPDVEQAPSFEDVTNPVIKWMNYNVDVCKPHSIIIVETDGARIYNGRESNFNLSYIKY